jgi:hypothetical protein
VRERREIGHSAFHKRGSKRLFDPLNRIAALNSPLNLLGCPPRREFNRQVDVVWLSRARKLGVTALWVGLGLWFLRGLRRSNSFTVSNLMMREWGVQPDAESRALRALEQAGLIIIARREKRSPRVTLVVGNTATEDAWEEFNRQGAAQVRAASV